MRMNADAKEISAANSERFCYYCMEGRCALCTGSDKTVIDGKVVEVPCAHGCQQQRRKPNQRVTSGCETLKRRTRA
jgi:hypothetical protein